MRIRRVLWKEKFVEKIESKHRVSSEEVEGILDGSFHVRKAARGRIPGEDLYAAYGRTQTGRCLIVFFIHKKPDEAMPISARDMTDSERRYYEKQK